MSNEIQIPAAYSIGPDTTIEQLHSMFFNSDALIEPATKMYRLQIGSMRVYYYFDEAGKPHFFTSVTTAIKNNLEMSPFLLDWMLSMGRERALEYMEERAHYGTFLHIETARFVIDKMYNLDELDDRLGQYMLEHNLPGKFAMYSEVLKRDMQAWAQFCFDYNYKPLAIEVVLKSEKFKIATALDHVGGVMFEENSDNGATTKAGKPKKTKEWKKCNVIIDIKSGRNGFYDSNEIQLLACKQIWEENYPHHTIDRIYNWSPKDWTGPTPTYNLKDQTNCGMKDEWEFILQRSMVKLGNSSKTVRISSGILEYGKEPKNIKVYDLEELVTSEELFKFKNESDSQD